MKRLGQTAFLLGALCVIPVLLFGCGGGASGPETASPGVHSQFLVPTEHPPSNPKPYSFPSSVNLTAKGDLPVGLLSTETFDATTVDPATVKIAVYQLVPPGAVKVRISQWAYATKSGAENVPLDDTNPVLDNLMDMVFHFNRQDLLPLTRDPDATCYTVMEGKTSTGKKFHSEGDIRIVKWPAPVPPAPPAP